MSLLQDQSLSHSLMAWWRRNGRQFPWRETSDPYRILVSEVLLHRTRAEQARMLFVEFIKQYPTPETLAESDPIKLQRILHPVGLFWRTRLLRKMAEVLLTEYEGEIPKDIRRLKSLPGISDYIAAAVACFAFGKPEPILDTNTVRIIGRVHGFRIMDSSRRNNQFRAAYRSMMDTNHAREFNYAMIDLGALVCTPKNPKCSVCPLVNGCDYAAGGGPAA